MELLHMREFPGTVKNTFCFITFRGISWFQHYTHITKCQVVVFSYCIMVIAYNMQIASGPFHSGIRMLFRKTTIMALIGHVCSVILN